jgi:hypothetical protein
MLLGVYVLGGLRGRQEARVRTHLLRCTRCRADYEELAEVPALLDLINSEEAASAGTPAGPAALSRAGIQGPGPQAGTEGTAAEVPPPARLRRVSADGPGD